MNNLQLRDQFAAAALPTLIAKYVDLDARSYGPAELSREAYELADAMLAERVRSATSDPSMRYVQLLIFDGADSDRPTIPVETWTYGAKGEAFAGLTENEVTEVSIQIASHFARRLQAELGRKEG